MSMTPDSLTSLGISLSKYPSMTAPVKDFEEQFGKVPRRSFSCCTKTLWGLMCASLSKQDTFLHLHRCGFPVTPERLWLTCSWNYHNCYLAHLTAGIIISEEAMRYCHKVSMEDTGEGFDADKNKGVSKVICSPTLISSPDTAKIDRYLWSFSDP